VMLDFKTECNLLTHLLKR